MSEINHQALREAAENATKGSYIVGHTSVNQHGNLTGVFVCQKWKGEPGGVIDWPPESPDNQYHLNK